MFKKIIERLKPYFAEKEVKKFLIIFYSVGILGLAIPFTFPLFKALIPYALILNFFLLFTFHQYPQNLKTFLVFTTIYLLSFAVESAGVHTKIIFGDYFYGNSIGPKLFDTPLIIGLNWLFLVYTTTSILEKYNFNTITKILVSSLMMVIYDFVIEQVAPKMDMWYWNENRIPLQNYVVWFILSIFLISLIKFFKINTQNKIAFTILICQFIFFVALYLIYTFLH